MSIVAMRTQLNFQLSVACVTSSDLHEIYTFEIFSQNYVVKSNYLWISLTHCQVPSIMHTYVAVLGRNWTLFWNYWFVLWQSNSQCV